MIVITRTGSSRRTKRPAAPTIAIPSNFDLPVYMSDIVIIGNPHFVKFGSLIVRRGQEVLLEIEAGDAALAQRLTIQTLGSKWTQNDQLEFDVWTSQGEATITVIVAQSVEPIEPGAVPLPMDIEQLNRLVATETGDKPNSAQELLAWLSGQDPPDPPAEWRELLMVGFGLHNQKSLADALAAGGYAEAAKRLAALDETLPIPNDDSGALFPNKIYFNESHARLVDMEANRNVIITMSAPQTPKIGLASGAPQRPVEGSYTLRQNPTGLDYTRETARDLERQANLSSPDDQNLTGSWIYDLVLPTNRTAAITLRPMPSIVRTASNAPAIVGFWFRRSPTLLGLGVYGAAAKFYLTVDNADNVGFASPTTLVARRAIAPSWPIFRLNATERYLRVRIDCVLHYSVVYTGDSPGSTVDPFQAVNWALRAWPPTEAGLEITDANITGGTGSVKFEVPNALGAWQEFIPPVAIARGQATSKQFGRANSSYILPSGPRALRARLDVTGALETSVAITLVS